MLPSAADRPDAQREAGMDPRSPTSPLTGANDAGTTPVLRVSFVIPPGVVARCSDTAQDFAPASFCQSPTLRLSRGASAFDEATPHIKLVARASSIAFAPNPSGPLSGAEDGPQRSPASPIATEAPVLIDPRKIKDRERFRTLFLGMLLMANASTIGLFSLYIVRVRPLNPFTVKQVVTIYTAGTVFGLFSMPFGALYDITGPRAGLAIATVLTSLGNLLIGLTIGGHITPTVTRLCVFFAMACWGSFAYDVTVLPTVVTHVPRNRGYPIGLLKTFSGLGASLITCLFRGFFNSRYDHLLYFMAAFVLVFGAVGTVLVANAPYVTPRLRARSLTPKAELQRLLVRNRYMSQLLPLRRLKLVIVVLMVMNIFLLIQGVCTVWYMSHMTTLKYRALAISALCLFLMCTVLIIPLKCLNGPTLEDEVVLAAAKERQEHLARRLGRRPSAVNEPYASPQLAEGTAETCTRIANGDGSDAERSCSSHESASTVVVASPRVVSGTCTSINPEKRSGCAPDDAVTTAPTVAGLLRQPECDEFPGMTHATPEGMHGKHHSAETIIRPKRNSGLAPPDGDQKLARHRPSCGYYPEAPDPMLIEVDVVTGDDNSDSDAAKRRSVVASARASDMGVSAPPTESSVQLIARRASTYNDPYVETINVCGDVFVAPVYQTTFLESLMYPDIWLIAWTTLVMWGIGFSITPQWSVNLLMQSWWGIGWSLKLSTLFSALSGLSVAMGRMMLGMYEIVLPVVRAKTGLSIPYTIGYTIPPVLLLIGMLLFLVVPANYALLVPYIISSLAYGMNTSLMYYVVGSVFERDIGLHYSFCFLFASIGVLVLYRFTLFEVYNSDPASNYPTGVCTRGRDCMQNTFYVYLSLAATAVVSSCIVHYRYWKLVRGKLGMKRK